jgi:hypothetical protein
MKPRLPLEIIDYIIDFLHDNRTSLRTCALVCRAWLTSSRRHLFEKVFISSAGGYFACRRLYKAIQQSPDIALHTRELSYSHIYKIHPASPIPIEPVPRLLRSFTMLRALQIHHIFWTHLTPEVRESIRTLLALPSLVHLAVDSVRFSELEHFTNLVRPHLKRLDISNPGFLQTDTKSPFCLQVDREVAQDVVDEPCRLEHLRIDLASWNVVLLFGSLNIIDISNLRFLECEINDSFSLECLEELLRHSGSDMDCLCLRLLGVFRLFPQLLCSNAPFSEYFDFAVMGLRRHPNLRVFCLDSLRLGPVTAEHLARVLSGLEVLNLQEIFFCFRHEDDDDKLDDITWMDDITWTDWMEVDRILNSEKFSSLHKVEIVYKAFSMQSKYSIRRKFVDHLPVLVSRELLFTRVITHRENHSANSQAYNSS